MRRPILVFGNNQSNRNVPSTWLAKNATIVAFVAIAILSLATQYIILRPRYSYAAVRRFRHTEELGNENTTMIFTMVARAWLDSEGVDTTYSTDHEIHRQLVHRMQKYSIAMRDDSELMTKQLSEIIMSPLFDQISKVAENSHKYLQLVTPSSDLVLNRLKPSNSKISSKDSVAIVIPFHDKELQKLYHFINSWTQYLPCVNNNAFMETSNNMYDIVWAFSGDFDSRNGMVIMETLLALQETLGDVFGCITSSEFVSLRLPEDYGHLDGACVTFQLLLNILKIDYKAMLILETDVRPIQSNWLDFLDKNIGLESACSEWWVQGSAPLCHSGYAPPDPIDVKRDFHINGNAIYAIQCPEFLKYMERIQLFYPPRPDLGWQCQSAGGCETGRVNEGGYDHAMYEYNHEVENFPSTRYYLGKFQYKPFIVNYCEDVYSRDSLLQKIPTAQLVHSKSAILSHEMKLAVQYYSRGGQYRDATSVRNDIGKLFPLLYTGEIELERLQTTGVIASKGKLIEQVPIEWKYEFPGKTYMWTVDFHSGPISCLIPILKEVGVVIHPEIDHGNCMYSGYCKSRLKVLSFNNWKGFSLESNGLSPQRLKSEFYKVVKDDPEFDRIDAFICSHPAANCQLFMDLNKSLIVYATTRIEFGRHDGGVFWRRPYWSEESGREKWKEWVNDLRTIAKSPRNIIATNNYYDKMYIKYFTGIDAHYVPSWCGDTNNDFDAYRTKLSVYTPPPVYMPRKDAFLIGSYRTNLDLMRNGSKLRSQESHPIMKSLRNAQRQFTLTTNYSLEIELISTALPKHYSVHALCDYKAMIVIPYQVSTISIMEYYRLNIPLFFPSNKLILQWHKEYDILWERIYGWPERMNFEIQAPNPNDNTQESLQFWIQFADWNILPFIQYFESFDDLMAQLHSVDLYEISSKMHSFNDKEKLKLIEIWSELLNHRIKPLKS